MRWWLVVFTFYYALCLSGGDALKTCWGKKCVDIFAVKFYNPDGQERQLRYDGNTGSLNLSDLLPEINNRLKIHMNFY